MMMLDSPSDRARVRSNIAGSIRKFVAARHGETFTMADSPAFVARDVWPHSVAPDSAGRIMRQLVADKLIDVVLVDRSRSLYLIEAS